MSNLHLKIKEGEEKEFYLRSKDFYRPPLKQVGRSIYEIKTHYMSKAGLNTVPSNCPVHLAETRNTLLGYLGDDSFLYKHNVVTGSSIEQSAEQDRCFPRLAVLMDSLALAMDLEISGRPSEVQCDILLAICGQPVIVLTLVNGDKDSDSVTMYNTSIARGVTTTLRKFMDDSMNIVSGVIHLQDMETLDTFKASVASIAEESAMFVTPSSFETSPTTFDKIVIAFWASVAESRSVISRCGRTDTNFLHFLTEDQCTILVENINNKEANVKFQSGTGATTLMLEVARRLARLEDTLLVCRSREEKERLRALYLNTKTVFDVKTIDLVKFTNIIDGTGMVGGDVAGKRWTFTKVYTDAEELQQCVEIMEKENGYNEKLILLLSSYDRQHKMGHLLREIEILKLLDINFQGLLVAYHLPSVLTVESKPVKRFSGDGGGSDHGLEIEGSMDHLLAVLKEGIRGRRDLFPLLGSITKQNKCDISYQMTKRDYLELGLYQFSHR